MFQEVPIDIINKIADCAPFIRGILFPTAIASLSFAVILTAAEVCHAVRFISGRYYELAADFFTHWLVLVYKCGQKKLNNLYYQVKEQRRCSTWQKNQKSYTPEFKQQIVDLYNSGQYSYPQLEREYGVSRSVMSNWVKQLSPIKTAEGGNGHPQGV